MSLNKHIVIFSNFLSTLNRPLGDRPSAPTTAVSKTEPFPVSCSFKAFETSDDMALVSSRVRSGDQDAGERPPGGHVLRRHQAALPHQRKAPEKGRRSAESALRQVDCVEVTEVVWPPLTPADLFVSVLQVWINTSDIILVGLRDYQVSNWDQFDFLQQRIHWLVFCLVTVQGGESFLKISVICNFF